MYFKVLSLHYNTVVSLKRLTFGFGRIKASFDRVLQKNTAPIVPRDARKRRDIRTVISIVPGIPSLAKRACEINLVGESANEIRETGILTCYT